ncbi:hypothetical protein XAR_0697 [Xanthomonas citri pv. glycines str. 8ra]|nr:hypothetical protein XAR_0697 [Xanthomonas citri pv. glycines str. 8ra]
MGAVVHASIVRRAQRLRRCTTARPTKPLCSRKAGAAAARKAGTTRTLRLLRVVFPPDDCARRCVTCS